MGGSEIILIIFVALLFFCSKAIPDIAKTLGKAMGGFQKATNENRREIHENSGGLDSDLSDIKSTIQNARNDIRDGIKTHTGDIQNEVNSMKKDIVSGTEQVTETIKKESKLED